MPEIHIRKIELKDGDWTCNIQEHRYREDRKLCSERDNWFEIIRVDKEDEIDVTSTGWLTDQNRRAKV